MKTVYSLLLLCFFSFTVKAQQINTIEYFFDSDPGIGNGTIITVTGTEIDSVINFDVSALQPGVHTFYVRCKNTNNQWSFTSSGNFTLFSGSGGVQITSLQYFVDTVANSITLPINATASLDTTISLPIADDGKDFRILGTRLMNGNGQLSNATLDTVSLCDLYKPFGGFRSVQFADQFMFIDSSINNPSDSIEWFVDNNHYPVFDNNKTFDYTFPSGFRGSNTIYEITGSGCRVDTSYYTIITNGIESTYPKYATFGHDVVLNIFGGNLDTTVQLYLQYGSTIVYPSDKASYQNKLLSADFDFHNITLSAGGIYDYLNAYDLHVHYQNGYDTIIREAIGLYSPTACGLNNLKQLPSGSPTQGIDLRANPCDRFQDADASYVTADLLGSGSIRAGTWNYYTLNVTNQSVALAKQTPIWLIIPAQYDVEFSVNWAIVPDTGINNQWEDFLAADYYQTIDTTINNYHYQYKMYGLMPAFINPGETIPIDFKIRSNTVAKDQIYYWVQVPMFGSPLGKVWDCVWDVLGYLPGGVGCFSSVVGFLNSYGGFPPGYQSDFSHGILWGATKDMANLASNVVGVGLGCTGKVFQEAKAAAGAALAKITKWETKLGNTSKGVSTVNNNGLDNCGVLDFTKEKIAAIYTYIAGDPNYITGNNDYDSAQHYINNYSPQHYSITFENVPTATGNAQHVLVTDTLNPDKFYFSTFSFTGYRIGDSSYIIPASRTQFFHTDKTKYDTTVNVRFVASFDTTTGIMKVDYFTMDSSGTKLIPDTSAIGFLPPNADGISGIGNVQFSIGAKNLNTLDTFTNKATIYFDNNAPIATNNWLNTIDTTAPSAQIIKVIPINDTTAQLVLQSSDVGSGIAFNELYAKGPNDSIFINAGRIYGDTAIFNASFGSQYQFYTIGYDNVGNYAEKSAADITYTFSTPLPVTLLSFTGNKDGSRVKLLWTTTNEINFSQFEVEKSADGINFSPLGSVQARNTTSINNYQLYDDHPLATANFYRLKMVDIDNSFTYSKIIRIDFDKKFALSLVPVPAHDYVVINGADQYKDVQFIDVNGRIVEQFIKPSGNLFSVTNLKPGVYYVRLSSETDTQVLKMIKQ